MSVFENVIDFFRLTELQGALQIRVLYKYNNSQT